MPAPKHEKEKHHRLSSAQPEKPVSQHLRFIVSLVFILEMKRLEEPHKPQAEFFPLCPVGSQPEQNHYDLFNNT